MGYFEAFMQINYHENWLMMGENWTCCFLKRNFLDWTTWACACSIVFLAHTLRHEEFGCKSRKLCDESMKMCWGTSNTCFIAPRASSSADAHQKFHSETQAALNLLLGQQLYSLCEDVQTLKIILQTTQFQYPKTWLTNLSSYHKSSICAYGTTVSKRKSGTL